MANASKPDTLETTSDLGLTSMEAIAGMTRQNMETMLNVAHGLVRSFEEMTGELSAYSRESYERTSAAVRAMTAVTNPQELMHMQSEFTRQQSEAAMAQMSRLSRMLAEALRSSLTAAVKQGSASPPRGGKA